MYKSYQDIYQWIIEIINSSHLIKIIIENNNSTTLLFKIIILKLYNKLVFILTIAKSAIV